MDRESIMNTVRKHISLNIDDLEDVEIDSRRSIFEYGASSLDLVEIVSGCIRDLRIQVPRTEIANLETIDDLVDLLTKYKESEELSAAVNARPGIDEEKNRDRSTREIGTEEGEV